jgi:hypothetical protein
MSHPGIFRIHHRIGSGIVSAALAALFVAGLTSCGRPSADDELINNGGTPVNGELQFASQCPYGTASDPQPARLELWDCPVGVPRLELSEPPKPVVFQADCKKKLLIVRNLERNGLDTMWEVSPDGHFSASMDGGRIGLGNLSGGACETNAILNVTGKLDCTDRDRVTITAETNWWLGQKITGSNTTLAGRTCSLPGGNTCRLYSSAKINQCH